MLRWGIWVAVLAVSVGSLGNPPDSQAQLGASGRDLVYTPVTPCRIIDTRSAGGPIGGNTQRDFLVSGTANFPAQGGTAGGCGIPEGATGAMLNFVAVEPAGPGDLRAWPFGQPVPGASIINYAAVAGLNIANGVAVPLCNQATAACTFDVSVQADVNGTQLVVDVLGFLQSTAPRGDAGAANTFLGINAGNFTTTGNSNTATGAEALQFNASGSGNTAMGRQALLSNTSGSNNTGTGSFTLNINSTGSNNTATGAQALISNASGINNTATGGFSLFANSTGNHNTATGTSALFSNNSSFNTATGFSALRDTTIGGFNTATGANALIVNTDGSSNTATGESALVANTSGTQNTATGVRALRVNTTGCCNTATGLATLNNNTTGQENTAIGYIALANNTTGIRNTAIGAGANVFLGTHTNATAIGYNAMVDADNKVRVGNTQVTVIEGQVPFTSVSDETKKENFQRVDGDVVLEKLRGVTVKSWNYIGHDPARFRHYGPSAQEFFAAFGHDGLGTIGSPTTLTAADMAAILMIAVQTLERRTAETAALKAELQDLRAKVEAWGGRPLRAAVAPDEGGGGKPLEP